MIEEYFLKMFHIIISVFLFFFSAYFVFLVDHFYINHNKINVQYWITASFIFNYEIVEYY